MSRFISEKPNSEESFLREIDFEDAIRLPDGGSTCDIFRTRWHRREVFVKRLKEEYRTNPLYLDALDKEYEIGVRLNHPALPDYREFHRDYIVMDYIDGETLANMIKRNDPWLKNEKNIIRMLRELVEITDYLHRHNVTHCDIKPDNIMITANNHNVVLIDLDKCYTDSFNDTSGDPSRYGLSLCETGRIAIDFHGIGRVVEMLKKKITDFRFRKYNKFTSECRSKECSADKLLEILDYAPVNYLKKYNWLMTAALFIAPLIFGFVLWLSQGGKNSYKESDGIIDIQPNNEINNTVINNNQDSIATFPAETHKESKPSENSLNITEPKPQEQIPLKAKEIDKEFDKRIQRSFNELSKGIDNLVALSNNPDVTESQLLDGIRNHIDKENEYIQEAFAILQESNPGLSDREAWRVMTNSKVYTGYKRKAEPILRELGLKIQSQQISVP